MLYCSSSLQYHTKGPGAIWHQDNLAPQCKSRQFGKNLSVFPNTALYGIQYIQGVFLNWYPPKKLKYGKPRLGESTLTYIGLDTPNLA